MTLAMAFSEETEQRKRDFAAWITRLREAVGYGTQQQAANAAGVSRVTWARYESGAALPTRDTCAGLAAALRVTEDEVRQRAGHAAKTQSGLPDITTFLPDGTILIGEGEQARPATPEERKAIIARSLREARLQLDRVERLLG